MDAARLVAAGMTGESRDGPDSGPPHRRSAARVRLYLPAILEAMTGRCRGTIVNLSTTGAQVYVDDVPALGTDVLLKCGGIDALALVVWIDGNVCGLEFDEPLSDEEVVSARRFAELQPEVRKSARIAAAKDWSEGN